MDRSRERTSRCCMRCRNAKVMRTSPIRASKTWTAFVSSSNGGRTNLRRATVSSAPRVSKDLPLAKTVYPRFLGAV
jgi:hypothetical protein